MTDQQTYEDYLTTAEAARLLKRSQYTTREYARRGLLQAYRVNGQLRFPRSAIEQWLTGTPASQ